MYEKHPRKCFSFRADFQFILTTYLQCLILPCKRLVITQTRNVHKMIPDFDSSRTQVVDFIEFTF